MPNPSGFDGFEIWLTDVEAEVKRLSGAATTAQAVAPSGEAAATQAPAQSDGATKKLLIGGAIAAVVVVVIALALSDDGYSPTTEFLPPDSPYNDAPTPYPVPTPVVEQTPPAGAGLFLNANEIAYCKAENYRLEIALPVIEVNPSNTDAFNARVDDYNRRCGNYQYTDADLNSALTYVSTNAGRLRVEATEWIVFDGLLTTQPTYPDVYPDVAPVDGSVEAPVGQ